jgi:two-component sensor histidine kinase
VTGGAATVAFGSGLETVEGRFRKALTLLAVQAWRSPDGRLRAELSSLADRIRNLVDRYELHRGSGARSIDAADYLEGLRHGLAAAANRERQRIRLTIASDVRELSKEGALLLGLIVNELVATALARAPADLPCRVTVRFGRDLSGYVLTAADRRRSGRETIFPQPEGVGMTLVRQLVRELEGAFTTMNGGADVEIRLSLQEGDPVSPWRNVSPRRTAHRTPLQQLSSKEDRH